jgi:hypothetical protein
MRETRRNVRALVCMFTGHGPVAKFIKIFGRRDDDICRFCRVEQESLEHIMCNCVNLKEIRNKHLGEANNSMEEWIGSLTPNKMLNYAQESGLMEILMGQT